ncbi:uncharacterized protein BO72DRAFT_382505 [Aspergillus fijiensis CBS 313.89]|uniref:IDI-2 n=1 Tax=Aspergillus fijiensis CBS 313.89 TaxID=1448319 RepID=A0A8G1VWQ7_9EURO|nr:uncharacterized protein BO72DRAFT_382505 [Aspergillus fijiensis CBS 313.89]RAK75437.1 hypothetical protein BO72DRAFT_382505 [Aspergillus fijiensis CBS 313.89]
MKPPLTIISMLALTTALTLTPRDAEQGDPIVECGDLDVMTVDPADLPAGVAPSDVRKCLDHPLGRNRHVKGASLAPLDAVDVAFWQNSTVDTVTGTGSSPVEARSDGLDGLEALEKRSCYKDAPYGCSGGYCWKACGNTNKGEWCWTAAKAGLGAWIKCSKWQDCGTATYACGRGGCPACGCGC